MKKTSNFADKLKAFNESKKEEIEKPKEEEQKKENNISEKLKAFSNINDIKKEENAKPKEEELKKTNSIADRIKNLNNPLNNDKEQKAEKQKEVVIDRENKRVNQVKKEIKDREKKIQHNKDYLSKEGNDILKIKKIRDKREKKALIQHDMVLEGYEKKRLKEAERTENKLKEYEDNLNEKRRARNEDYNEKLRKIYQEH